MSEIYNLNKNPVISTVGTYINTSDNSCSCETELNYIGLDTSNYTTSAAIYSKNNKIQNMKKLLPVIHGALGLRQNDAVFNHCKQLPEVFEGLKFTAGSIKAIAVSNRPRNTVDSYMPCFTVGDSFAVVLGKSLNIPVYRFSHQQGHIASGIISCGRFDLENKSFLSFHLSGGTTELLYCNGYENISLLLSTTDITAGQLIDRAGVKLGLHFPCGVELEKLAFKGKLPEKPKITLKNGCCCLSGFENKIDLFIKNNINPKDIALYVLEAVKLNIKSMIEFVIETYGGTIPILFVGGVSSNKNIRNYLTDNYNALFAEPDLSCDNAVGIARLAMLENNK